MRSYQKPKMEIEMFQGDVILTSGSGGCGAADDEVPIIPFGEEDETDLG